MATYFSFVLVLSLITAEKCNQTRFYAIYLTNWNVMLNAFSSIFGALLATFYHRGVVDFDDEKRETPKLIQVYWLLSTLSTVVSISLSCVYWPLIYNGRDKGINDSLTHAGNAIVWFIDIFINAHPPRFGHFVYPLCFGVFYAYLFSLPYTLLGGTDRDLKNFIYSVLDWRNNSGAAFTFATATVTFLTIMHFVLTSLGCLRVYLHNWSRKISLANQRSDNDENNHQYDNPSINL